jgi:hypothetical protein
MIGRVGGPFNHVSGNDTSRLEVYPARTIWEMTPPSPSKANGV